MSNQKLIRILDKILKHQPNKVLTNCTLCNSPHDNKKIKNQNICLSCYIAKEKPYKLVFCGTYGNLCGGSDIYKVIPNVNKLRLHNLVHFEYYLKGIRTKDDFCPVYNWNDIWDKMDGWFNPKWKSKFNGKLVRGIYSHDGNGMIAFVEDKKGDIYYVHGVWG
ncbi:putative ORFan [Tupanvirus deep ocean]|uniref:ORFan n=2 Tax=Tupanvirus TaxID=2094720 RepID=A0AC62A752_9VIRU|nr:putative ORFan [Tupanvirus deep ocean]QKU33525.1 putative ORFan [Tupanvirus deep ocean]